MSKSTPKKPNTPTQIEWSPIESVTPYARNPRKIGANAVSAVAGSIKEFGFKSPIIVDKDRVIINGHTRLKAAQQLGLKEVPVVVASDLTPEQVRAYRIADNRSAEFSKWDEDFLKVELDDIGDIDLSFCNVDEMLAELAEQSQEEPQEQLTEGDPDAVPAEAQGEPVSQRGEVFELGPHRLMCGDSTSADDWHSLLGGERGDMLFTDPPYGVNYEGGGFQNEKKREKLNEDDSTVIYDKFLPVVLPLIDGPCYMWHSSNKSPEVFESLKNNNVDIHACLIWHKTNAKYAAMGAQYKNRHEPMVYFKPKGKTLRWVGASDESTLWEVKRDASNTMHPTQKPVELACRAIKNHDAKIVIDAFAGSGSTLIACAMTSRICRTMEISPRYCDVIRRRWTKFAKENKVNPGTGALE
jgi:site-specific DNA-methyltransferase (adenine-specific)